MNEPNLERIALLADTLDSPEFEQATETLRTPDNRFCCLGVACELARRGGAGIEWTALRDEADGRIIRWSIDGEQAHMPPEVWQWFGFPGNNPRIKTGGGEPAYGTTMTSANDSMRLTFPEIADALRRTYGIGKGQRNG